MYNLLGFFDRRHFIRKKAFCNFLAVWANLSNFLQLRQQVTKHGLKSGNLIDRQFVIIDAGNGNVVTGRKFPKLVLIDVDVRGGSSGVYLTGPGVESIEIAIPQDCRNLEKICTNVQTLSLNMFAD